MLFPHHCSPATTIFKFASLALLPFIIDQAPAADVFYTVPITNVTVAPDGFPRQVIQAGTFPGMHLSANKGDVLHINVTMNQDNPAMRRSTSIHWHGIFQDRTASLLQTVVSTSKYYCRSALSTFMDDSFPPASKDTTTRCLTRRGLIGSTDPDDPLGHLYDIDDDSTIIILADWYHSPAAGLMDQFKIDGATPVPSSGLINGIGRYNGGPEVPWAVINVVQGKRYRFRVINQLAYAAYTFSIDGHVFEVIETDGIETVPLAVTSFEIYVAQCYSIIRNATNNYWIRAPIVSDVQGNNPDLDAKNVKAILRYAGAPIADPTTSELIAPVPLKGGQGGGGGNQAKPFQEFELATLIDPGAPGGDAPADHVISLDFNAAGPGNEVVELQIHGSDHGITHPFHLHGHAFDIVKSSSGPFDYVNPPRRDVIGVDQGGVVIRFRAPNWAGLAVVFAEAPEEQRVGPAEEVITPQWLDLCPAYYAQDPALQ
ncbi:Cupredoxin [Mycena capillaripes]|nr:Cupredoxin [Mycena capillaripes]